MHITEIQPRFTDYDMFGHVNNNAYMQFLDLGKSMFFNTVIDRPFDPESLSAVIVNINIDFKAPTLPSEPIEVHTAVHHIGDRSFALIQEILNPQTAQIKAHAITTLAGFDVATQTSAPLRPSLKKALAQHLHDDSVERQ